MKTIVAIIVNIILLGNIQFLFAQKLSFTYDSAGNQQKREWLCINCPQSTISMDTYEGNELKASKPIKVGDISLISDSAERIITMSWLRLDISSLREIEILDTEDKVRVKIPIRPNQGFERFSFSNLPASDYRLFGQYSKGAFLSSE